MEVQEWTSKRKETNREAKEKMRLTEVKKIMK